MNWFTPGTIVAIATLITSLGGFIGVLRQGGKVHSLVNNQLDKQLQRNEQLTRTLTKENIDVPERERNNNGS